MITSNAINTFHGVWHYVYENMEKYHCEFSVYDYERTLLLITKLLVHMCTCAH